MNISKFASYKVFKVDNLVEDDGLKHYYIAQDKESLLNKAKEGILFRLPVVRNHIEGQSCKFDPATFSAQDVQNDFKELKNITLSIEGSYLVVNGIQWESPTENDCKDDYMAFTGKL